MQTHADPCSQPSLMHPDQAIVKLLEQVKPITDSEVVTLPQALGRVLAEDLASHIDLPPFDNSAMDGYAFTYADLASGQPLKLIGQSFAGHPYTGKCPADSCIRIMTGAPVPSGYDTVQMQEKVNADGEHITIEAPKEVGANVRCRGEELSSGTKVLNAGTLIGAAEMGVLATIGVSQLRVKRIVKVAFFSTGDELRPVGSELGPGQIYDSNRYSIQGMLSRGNIEWIDLGVVEDNKEAIRQAFKTASECADMVITSGGVSVGDADYTKQILDEEGQITFWKLAIKPGKPFAFGHLGNAVFCGLPGNPVSSMVTFYKLVWPLLTKMQGLPQTKPVTLQATLKGEIRKQAGRVEYQRAILSYNANGEAEVAITGGQGSGMLTSMTMANCFIILAQDCDGLTDGTQVTVEPFNGVLS
ncbi:molybdopterin molybdotransferase MoeA [Shewanella fidelis]|uniref:Molybdopterin molybdenumtransferase n=1 Tax=Shewanella fidelis TaxID=173509 RepID=A0AAW8NT34_9GAMM|nr:molybdopterin molybdotransferase MoeA [Shewanella fidelis]MDR8525976.1 molybdopterin molybdotransferase MoeA [Shewanella fidelis]MDW4813836.1 molybdopterin molybdotransferase MoeA [Shewanella fidelis]MDW4817972.1 molybdopterin molybdotransferase MoeA [Shewanella fidelis]MDW4822039.1 molybdopterin molybdotransferase MoeA [Shewanella fidelis]MDW4826204.1 molybdopterin molybdotransferase MoeA [Shewanella fidelis]